MIGREIGRDVPIKIAVYCVLWLAVSAVFCLELIGPETVMVYASRVKPYSMLLSEHSYQGLSKGGDSTTVICFGDSNSFRPPGLFLPDPANSDIYMPALIRDAVDPEHASDFTFLDWSYAAADMFDYYCLFFEAVDFSPDLMIVPINWRSFQSDWIDHPNWFHPELSALVPFSERRADGREKPVEARGISVIKQLEYKIYLYSLYVTGMKSWASERMRSLLGSHFRGATSAAEPAADEKGREAVANDPLAIAPDKAFNIDAKTLSDRYSMEITRSNPTFVSLCALAGVASERGVKALFYIWPLDLEYLGEAGVLDRATFERSKLLISAATQKEGIYFVDLSGLLEHRHFYDWHGHCTVEGRRKIADALAPAVVEILGERPDGETG
jgi:hypothetical protein